MSGMMFEVKITAVGEVRDGVTGELISAEPYETTRTFTEDELRAQGLTDEQICEIKERGAPQ